MTYLEGVTAENFDWRDYLAQFDARLLASSAGRRALCKYDPLLFAILYCRHLLVWPRIDGEMSFSDFHLDLCRDALRFAGKSKADDDKIAYIAARGGGKSMWNFTVLPLWRLAHRHSKFLVAFGDTSENVKKHLITFKGELDRNTLLRLDHPRLCAPQRRPTGVTVSDSTTLYIAESGVVMMVAGIESTTLGSAVGGERPDDILFDDVEPPGATYSAHQKKGRLKTITDAVFPMNPDAVVTFVGTVNMPGAIMHDIIRYVTDPNAEDLEEWVLDHKIVPKYYPLLASNADGERKSTWEQRYPTDWCLANEHIGSWQLSYMNNAMGRDGGYWTKDDFRYVEPDSTFTRWILEIDPAVTSKITSDYTGLAVVACSPRLVIPGRPDNDPARRWSRVCVVEAWQVKVVGDKLRKRVMQILEMHPQIKAVRIEVNQGGEYIPAALHDLPAGVKLLVHTSTVSKDVRHSWGLDYYQRGRVQHSRRLRVLEDEMIGYPEAAYDDVSDAAVSGILFFLGRPKPIDVGESGESSNS